MGGTIVVSYNVIKVYYNIIFIAFIIITIHTLLFRVINCLLYNKVKGGDL